MNTQNLKLYGEDQTHIYYTDTDGLIVEYNKEKKEYRKQINSYDNKGNFTGFSYKTI